MPRIVTADERIYAIQLMTAGITQREIERETKLSRPYIRKLADEIGHKFPQNGVEIIGKLCMCQNCGLFFRRPQSKVDRAKSNFCSTFCKKDYQRGINHPNWQGGKKSSTFSQWAQNQAAYNTWRNACLERAGHKCEITGRTENLHVHHILMKGLEEHQDKVFDPKNGLVLNREVHEEIHRLIREGLGFEESISKLKEKYNTNLN